MSARVCLFAKRIILKRLNRWASSNTSSDFCAHTDKAKLTIEQLWQCDSVISIIQQINRETLKLLEELKSSLLHKRRRSSATFKIHLYQSRFMLEITSHEWLKSNIWSGSSLRLSSKLKLIMLSNTRLVHFSSIKLELELPFRPLG